MDKSSDSSSDSDSSSSTSWVFIEDTSNASPKTANTFHLDCSREPIQELTEQDLLSAGSDFESDTDGISVISESEVPTEDPCLNIQSFVCTNDTPTIEDKTDHSDHDINTVYDDIDVAPGKEVLLVKEPHEKLTKIKPLHMLGIGVVLTAVFLGCYSRITTKMSKENADFNNDDVLLYDKIDDVKSYNKVDLTSCNDVPIKIYDTKTDLNKDLEEIVDITMTCAFHHKPKNDILTKQIKKCVKNEYNTKKTGKNTEKVYSETFESIKRYKKIEIKQKKDNDLREELERQFNKGTNAATKCNKNDDTICKMKNENHANYKKKDTDQGKLDEYANKKDKINVIKLRLPKKKQNLEEEIKKDYKTKENHERPSENQIPTKTPYNKYQKDKKDKKYHYVDKTKYNKNYNKYQKNIKHKNENNENKFKEVPNKYPKSKDSKYKDKKSLKKRNNTTTGEWYINLHKARTQIRKQEHISDWVFDRAYLRNKKRNKAQWYFKWMNIREQLRYKQSYKPYSS